MILTSSVQIQRGLGSTSLAVPSAGGTVSVNTRAAEVDPGSGIKMSIGDNGYQKFTAFLIILVLMNLDGLQVFFLVFGKVMVGEMGHARRRNNLCFFSWLYS